MDGAGQRGDGRRVPGARGDLPLPRSTSEGDGRDVRVVAPRRPRERRPRRRAVHGARDAKRPPARSRAGAPLPHRGWARAGGARAPERSGSVRRVLGDRRLVQDGPSGLIRERAPKRAGGGAGDRRARAAPRVRVRRVDRASSDPRARRPSLLDRRTCRRSCAPAAARVFRSSRAAPEPGFPEERLRSQAGS